MADNLDKMIQRTSEPPSTKGARARQTIAESTVATVARSGDKIFSYKDIGDASGMSRQLIKHHFPDKDALWMEAAILVRLRFQKAAIAGLEKMTDAREMLERYIHQTLHWPQTAPKDAKFWLIFTFRAIENDEIRQLNSRLAKIGTERICALVQKAVDGGQLNVNAQSLTERVILLQGFLAGILIQQLTDSQLLAAEFQDPIIKQCLAILEN